MTTCLDCLLLMVLVTALAAGQPQQVPVEAPSEDAVDLRPDGGYAFRYNNRDEGGHYGEAVATPDNTVAGKFGQREPGSGRAVETRYTAGERGFRPQGPTVHRRYDLSQVKAAYSPPVSPDSPNYQPSYSTYYDPNEDSTYHFDFGTNEYKRTENGGPQGQIAGAYSYIDDAGDIHNVEFEAGSQTGFHVKTPHPDSNHNYNELYFRGDGKVPLRGRTSIQRGVDGSYRFTTHSQDQRRSEVKDAAGNTRGSYTYIDKDGVQRTVQYIAGPNIGYKIVNQGIAPNVDPQFPFVNPNFIPTSLQGASGKPVFSPGPVPGRKPAFGAGGNKTPFVTTSPLFGAGGEGVGGGKPPKGSKPRPSFPPQPAFGFDSTTSSSTTSTPIAGSFGQDGNSFGTEDTGNFGGVDSSSADSGSSFSGDGFGGNGGSSGGNAIGGSGNTGGNDGSFNAGEGSVGGGSTFGGGDNGNNFGAGDGSFGGGEGGNSFGGSGGSVESASPNGGSGGGGSGPFRPGGSLGVPSPRPPISCCPAASAGSYSGSGGFQGSGVDSNGPSTSSEGEPPYSPSGQKPNKKPFFTPSTVKPPKGHGKPGKPSRGDFLSSGYPPPNHAGFPEEDPNSPKPFQDPSFKPFTVEDSLFLQRPFSSLPPAGSSGFYPERADDLGKDNGYAGPPPFYDEILDKDATYSEGEFTGFPPGVSVKARVQSLDIQPFGSKVPSPGEVEEFEQHRPHPKRRSSSS